MTHPAVTVPDDCPLEAALHQMRANDIRHVLVLESGRLAGILSTRDLGRLVVAGRAVGIDGRPVREVMTESPVTVAPETSIAVAARVLLELRIGALPVRDDDLIVGILTVADVLEALLVMAERDDSPSRRQDTAGKGEDLPAPL